MNLIAFVLGILAFLSAAIAWLAPNFVSVVAATTNPSVSTTNSLGPLLANTGDLGFQICANCASFADSQVAVSVIFGVSVGCLIGAVMSSAFCDNRSLIPMWIFSASFALQATATVVFLLRSVPSLQSANINNNGADSSWTFGWSSYLELVAGCLTFIAVIVTGVLALFAKSEPESEPEVRPTPAGQQSRYKSGSKPRTREPTVA